MKEKKWTDLGCKLNTIYCQWKDHNYIFLASLHVFWTTKLQIQNSLKVYLFQFFLKSSYFTPLRPTNLNLKKIIFDIVTMICSIRGSFFWASKNLPLSHPSWLAPSKAFKIRYSADTVSFWKKQNSSKQTCIPFDSMNSLEHTMAAAEPSAVGADMAKVIGLQIIFEWVMLFKGSSFLRQAFGLWTLCLWFL